MEHYDWEKPEDVMTALLTIHSGQTLEEQKGHFTVEQNGVGFNSVDAPIMSSFAEQVLSGRYLSERQLGICKTVLPKYAKQLTLLQRSILPPQVARPTFTPPPAHNGTLKIEGEYLLFFPNVYPSNKITQLGFKWQPSIKGWKGILRESMIEGVERLFSPIQLDPTVTEFLEKASDQTKLTDQTESSQLFGKQKEAVQFMKRHKRVLLGMAPGTGKTATSIFAANELKEYDDILVVCPLSLVRNWKNEIKKWLGEEAVIWHGPVSNWSPYRKWVVTNYETFMRNLDSFKAQGFKVAIFDESIVMKNRKAKRSEKAEEFSRDLHYVWLLSGSPVSKFLDDMWSQLHVVDRKRFTSYWKFVDQYCIKEVDQWGTHIVGNQDDAFDRLKSDLSDVYFSCVQSDFLDIPDWIFDTLEVPMSPTQYRYYDQMEKEFLADLPDGDQVLAFNTLSQMIRLIQFASNPALLDGENDGCKWKAAEELLQFEKLPAIIWTQFIHTADMMSHKLSTSGFRVARLTGQTEAMSRQDIVDRFQSGGLDVIVAHPAVGKFGLTLTAAHTAIYMERDFNGDNYYQSLYRIKRIGTTESPHVFNLIASRPSGDENTIDHVIDRVLAYRKDSALRITASGVTSGLIREMLGKSTKGK